MTLEIRFGGAGHDRSTWLVLLFLIVGVAAPAACVVWFMNEAAESQAASAKQAVMDAYRGQLKFIRDRVDQAWKARLAELDRQAGIGSPQDFARIATKKLAD